MKKILLFLLLFVILKTHSQKAFSKEIGFSSDNDLYTSISVDRYYTNGLFLFYRYASKDKNKNLEKKILEWQIGHKMYTPYKASVSYKEAHDRPFAAYLYGSFSINKFYKNNQNLKTTLQLGVLGSNAFGKELQNFIHKRFGFEKATGWKYQIKNAFGANLNVNYTKFLIKDVSNHFDILWVNTGKLGTIYTNVSSGFLGRIGFRPLQKLANSIAFQSNINSKNSNAVREIESFIYLKPTLEYALYDATLQGSFLHTESEVTKKLVPLVFNLEIGFKFTANRFNFGYIYNYNSSKSKGLNFNHGHNYGSILMSYLLR
ncbi:MAG: lipid A deacylase LpxR family protein [Polaribacter sp.]